MLEFILKEGRNRQIRRMCDVVGYHVRALRRTGYGPLRLGDMEPGASRNLTPSERSALLRLAGLDAGDGRTLAAAGAPGETATREEGPMIKEFRDFLLRGNIVELAVAFVIGAAFALVVKSLNDNLLMPIIAMIGGKPDFSSLTFTINGAVFRYGAFITDLIGFVLTAAAVFFFVVKPINAIVARRKRGEEVAPEETPEEIELLREIRDALRAR